MLVPAGDCCSRCACRAHSYGPDSGIPSIQIQKRGEIDVTDVTAKSPQRM